MASLVPVQIEMLAHVIACLNTMTPDDFEAPDEPAPAGTLRFMGSATDAQRAMSTLLKKARAEHARLHTAINLPYGAHPDLPKNHRKRHVLIEVLKQLLYEDLTQTFEPVGEYDYYIDDQWNAFWVEA